MRRASFIRQFRRLQDVAGRLLTALQLPALQLPAPQLPALQLLVSSAALATLACQAATPAPVAAQSARESSSSDAESSRTVPRVEPVGAEPSESTSALRPSASRQEQLEVPPFAPSLVSLPADAAATEANREFWIMAVHGAGDSARYQCEFWREVLGVDVGIVVCPTGKPIHRGQEQGFFFASHLELEREVLAASKALSEIYADRLGTKAGIYAAYSQGATMGSLMIIEHAALFPRLLLIEGGFSEWNVARAEAFREKGGRQIGFVCGTQHCFNHAQRAVMWLEKAGVGSRLWYEPRAGHTYAGLLTPHVQRGLEWLLTGE